MWNNATFVDKEQLKNLKKIDTWLAVYVTEDLIPPEIIKEVRDLITRIEKQGYYYEGEAEILNMIGKEYNQYKKQNR
jgi:hypothetical protein|tara:strand:+ start:320 stop:550 length:231 start_codon:yes stop_codon:yes gene_type:complete